MKAIAKSALLLVLLIGLQTGCRQRLVFATHTSLGLDVSGTAQYPNKVSLSHNRYEAAIVPRKADGEAHSVFGGLDSDISFWKGSIIKQTFATGEAANLATGGQEARLRSTSNDSKAPLVFVTATTFGLHLSAGESQMAPNLLMGYRRSETSVIPVPDSTQEVRSVYADILINTKSHPDDSEPRSPASAITTNFPSVAGVRIKQSFATGKAANQLARYSEAARANLRTAAGVDLASDIMRRNKLRAEGIVQEIGNELDRFANAQLDEVVDVFHEASLISSLEAKFFRGEPDFRTRCLGLKRKVREEIGPDELPLEVVQKLEDILSKLREIASP
jgi:hypothetical protein